MGFKDYIWKFKEPSGSALEALSQETGLSRLSATVCLNRGLDSAAQVAEFLSPKLEHLTHPFKILDLEKAVDRLILAHEKKEKIRIYTDYDVDGTTGAALMSWVLRELRFDHDVVQPDRFKDGYGLNPPAIDQAHEDGVQLLITVDCGITNFEAAERAQALGIDLMIVDHHLIHPEKGLPPAFAILDPHRADDESGLTQLCGCALAFYLCMGLRIRLRDQGYFEKTGIPIPNLKNHLDLVVVATAADMVPLTGDNRILVRHGLQVLKDTQKPGLRALIETAGIQIKTFSASNLGFALGPRINASGRMGSAETAYRVLTTEDEAEGRQLAQELELINAERATIQNSIWDQVREVVTREIEKGRYQNAIVVGAEGWHEGVVGIVASRVTEHFKKPAIVLSFREDGIAKGSARSYGGYDILEGLHQASERLSGYGGHKFAAGMSLPVDSVDAFADHYDQIIGTLDRSKTAGELFIESNCEPQDLTHESLEQLEQLAPFGPGNPEPLFSMQMIVQSQRVLKGRHLKLQFNDGIEGIWFNAAERIEFTEMIETAMREKKPCYFAGVPELNRFLGRKTPTLRIKSAQPNL